MGGWGLQDVELARLLHLVRSGFLHRQDVDPLFPHGFKCFDPRALPVAIGVPGSDLQLLLGLAALETLVPHRFPVPVVLGCELLCFD